MSQPWKRPALAAALALALGGATGRLLLDSMNDLDAAVLAAPGQDGDPPAATAPASRRLVIAVLDGLGEEAFLSEVQATGRGPDGWDFRATVDCGTPSLSRPVYHVLLTGVPQAVSSIRNNSYSGRARADDLAARVRASGGSVGWALDTVTWFHDLFGAPGDRLAHMNREPLSERAAGQAPPGDPFPAMTEVVFANPTLAVLHYTGIDGAGHRHGAASPEYRAAVQETLGRVMALRDAHAATPAGRETVWMIGADHGHLPGGGHGGPEMAVRRTAWVGLWPGPVERRVRIPGVVPAVRLAATFAAILDVPPPADALGDPLELPDRAVAPAAGAAERRAAVLAGLARSEEDGRRGMLARAAALSIALAAVLAILVRRGKASSLAGAAAPALGACAGFLVLGPGLTLSAIRTHLGFLSQSTAAMALGAAIAHALARRWRAPWAWVMAAAGAFPAAALAITAGSMGQSHAPDALFLVLPASGLVPAGVLAGVGAAWAVGRLVAMRRGRTRGGLARTEPSEYV